MENHLIKKTLEKILIESSEMFSNPEISKSYIIGYLEGAIKTTLIELK
jgi:hypothetical protein